MMAAKIYKNIPVYLWMAVRGYLISLQRDTYDKKDTKREREMSKTLEYS